MKIIFKFLSIALLLTIFLSSCSIPRISNPLNTQKSAAQIDARVFKTIEQMYVEYPYSRQLAAKASGLLVMPLVTEAGFGVGAGYGRGALVVNGSVKNYYSSISANTWAKNFRYVDAVLLNGMTGSKRRPILKPCAWRRLSAWSRSLKEGTPCSSSCLITSGARLMATIMLGLGADVSSDRI